MQNLNSIIGLGVGTASLNFVADILTGSTINPKDAITVGGSVAGVVWFIARNFSRVDANNKLLHANQKEMRNAILDMEKTLQNITEHCNNCKSMFLKPKTEIPMETPVEGK